MFTISLLFPVFLPSKILPIPLSVLLHRSIPTLKHSYFYFILTGDPLVILQENETLSLFNVVLCFYI